MIQKMQKLVETNRGVLAKDHADHSKYSLDGLSPEEIYEEFQKSIRDMNKRIDFLHMRIESDQKGIPFTPAQAVASGFGKATRFFARLL